MKHRLLSMPRREMGLFCGSWWEMLPQIPEPSYAWFWSPCMEKGPLLFTGTLSDNQDFNELETNPTYNICNSSLEAPTFPQPWLPFFKPLVVKNGHPILHWWRCLRWCINPIYPLLTPISGLKSDWNLRCASRKVSIWAVWSNASICTKFTFLQVSPFERT